MFNKLLKIYALIICLGMTIALFFISVNAYDIVTDLYLPKYKYSYRLKKFNSNKEFLKSVTDSKEHKALAMLADAEITNARNKIKEEYLADIKSDALAKSIKLSGWLLITVIFLYVHWNLYKKTCVDGHSDI